MEATVSYLYKKHFNIYTFTLKGYFNSTHMIETSKSCLCTCRSWTYSTVVIAPPIVKIYCKLQTPENLSYRLQTKEVRDFTEILFKLTYGHGGSLTPHPPSVRPVAVEGVD